MSTETETPTVPHGRYADQPIEAVPQHQRDWMMAMNTSIADKIAALLERTDKLKRGSDVSRPVVFNAAGQAHAGAAADADEAGRTLSNSRSMPAVCRGPDPAEDPSPNQATPSSGGPSHRLCGQQRPAIERGLHVLPPALAGDAQHDTAPREWEIG